MERKGNGWVYGLFPCFLSVVSFQKRRTRMLRVRLYLNEVGSVGSSVNHTLNLPTCSRRVLAISVSSWAAELVLFAPSTDSLAAKLTS